MLKKTSITFTLIISIMAFANGQTFSVLTAPTDEVVARYKHLSAQQLLDVGNYHNSQNQTKEALMFYNLLIHLTPQPSGTDYQKNLIEAHHHSSAIYYHRDNYHIAYEHLLKALQLSEMTYDTIYRAGIYITMGNVYHRLDKQDLAKAHFLEALNFAHDSADVAMILNNLGYACVVNGDLDEAFLYLNQSLQIAKQHNPSIYYIVLHSLAMYHQAKKAYDSAYHYYQLALDEAHKGIAIQNQKGIAITLSDLGKLFFEINRTDSALFYINLSNNIATENTFLGILMDNCLVLSKIADIRGNRSAAFAYLQRHLALKDSTLKHDKVVEVSQMQRTYEISKTNQQIEQLTIEQQVKDKTIHYQKMIRNILLAVIIMICTILAFVFIQNKKLNTAYKKLFEKNVKIIELQESSNETHPEKYQESNLTNEMQSDLLARVYTQMEDVSVVCDTEFSLDKLAKLVQSNRVYVSQIINDVLKKNFRTFINEYRILEAQRLFSEKETAKHTIEFIANKTGFKSRTSFIAAFKEITGVSPSFYLKSMQEQ